MTGQQTVGEAGSSSVALGEQCRQVKGGTMISPWQRKTGIKENDIVVDMICIISCANVLTTQPVSSWLYMFLIAIDKNTWNIIVIAWQLNRDSGRNWSLQWWWINTRRGGRLNANWPACQLECKWNQITNEWSSSYDRYDRPLHF